MTAKSAGRENQEKEYGLDERARGLSEIVRENNIGEVEFELNIDKIMFEGFDRQSDPRVIEETIKQRLTSFLSEHINLNGFGSQMMRDGGMSGTNKPEKTQNFFSAANLDGGSISLKSGRVDSLGLVDDVGKAIVRGLTSLNEK